MWGNLECAAPYSRTKTVRLSDCVMLLESTLVHLLTMGCKSRTQALQGLLHAFYIHSKSQKNYCLSGNSRLLTMALSTPN